MLFRAIHDLEKPRHLSDVKHLLVVVLWQGRIDFSAWVIYVTEMRLRFNDGARSAIRKHGFYDAD